MSGTGGSMVVHNGHFIEGEVITIPQGGTFNKVFPQPASFINLHNMTADILEVEITSNVAFGGSGIVFVAAGSALNFGDLPMGYITGITVTDTNAGGNGGGSFILNAHYN